MAHRAFFRVWPEFAANQNKVSIFGESYAGIYVPQFLDEWLNDPIPGINFHGVGVGNGMAGCIPNPDRSGISWCTTLAEGFVYPNSNPGPHWDLQFFWGHAQLSNHLHKTIYNTCTEEELLGKLDPKNWSAQCHELIYTNFTNEVGQFGDYNLFDSCLDHPPHRKPVLKPIRRFSGRYGNGDTGLGPPCAAPDLMMKWLDLPSTKAALGIFAESQFLMSDNGVGMDYTINAPFVGPIYKRAIAAGKKVLIYEGDSDAIGLGTVPIQDIWVPYFSEGGAGTWTPSGYLPESLNLTMTMPWTPWVSKVYEASKNGMLGDADGMRVQHGYRMEWKDGQVAFVSTRGAGHESPYYRPMAARRMMEAFLKD